MLELLEFYSQKGWNILHYACCSDFEQDGQSSVQWLLETIPDEILSDADKSNLLSQKNDVRNWVVRIIHILIPFISIQL